MASAAQVAAQAKAAEEERRAEREHKSSLAEEEAMRMPRWDAVAQQPGRDEEATSAFAAAVEDEPIQLISRWDTPPPQQPQQQPQPSSSSSSSSSSAGEAEEPSAARKFCMACGTKLPATAKFCSACGERQA